MSSEQTRAVHTTSLRTNRTHTHSRNLNFKNKCFHFEEIFDSIPSRFSCFFFQINISNFMLLHLLPLSTHQNDIRISFEMPFYSRSCSAALRFHVKKPKNRILIKRKRQREKMSIFFPAHPLKHDWCELFPSFIIHHIPHIILEL